MSAAELKLCGIPFEVVDSMPPGVVALIPPFPPFRRITFEDGKAVFSWDAAEIEAWRRGVYLITGVSP